MSLELDVQVDVQPQLGIVGRLRSWYYGIKEKNTPLTENEQIFLEGLQFNFEEQSLHAQLSRSLPYSPVALSKIKGNNELRFKCSLGAYETLKKCQDIVSRHTKRRFDEYRLAYKQLMRLTVS